MRAASVLLLGLAALTSAALIPEQQPLTTTTDWSWSICGEGNDPVKIYSIEVSPDPPQPGKELTVTVKGEAIEPIREGATADVTVKVGAIKILSKTFDVCDEARNANASIQCPVEPGVYTVVHSVDLPKEIPRAKFSVNIQGYTDQEEDMLCLKLDINFMKRPFPRLW